MLIDLDRIVEEYRFCQDCYYGYDNYDQIICKDFCSHHETDITPGAKIPPRFDRCKLVRVYDGPLPPGTINCITLVADRNDYNKRNDYNESERISISRNGELLYIIRGVRTMVLINGGDIHINNFNGMVFAHYVNYELTPGTYRISTKNTSTINATIKYFIFRRNLYKSSFADLQTMWNYVYPGERPKGIYLYHEFPSKESYYTCRAGYFRGTIENATYNELKIENEHMISLRFPY
jgi:hypothetical protein